MNLNLLRWLAWTLAIAGVYVLAGIGWALLTAALFIFLLLIVTQYNYEKRKKDNNSA